MTEKEMLSQDWKHLRGAVKERWHALNDQDLDIINGDRNVLVGVLQARYLYSQEVAKNEVNRFLSEIAREKQMSHG